MYNWKCKRLILISATDLKTNIAHSEVESFLIAKLIEQTGDSMSDFNKKRWQNRFSKWETDQNRVAPNLVVFIDGLNQQPNFEWVRWLEGANLLLERLGGVLVLSSRECYFTNRIKNGLMSQTQIISVREWTKAELSEILGFKGNEINKLNPSVTKTLKNPRVLAIAFDLLDNAHIEGFDELSVERLLLEHIRASERDGNALETPDQFIKRLSEHAQAITDRIKEENHEDRLVFETTDASSAPPYNLSADLLAVTEGRFFNSLPKDPTLYSLSDEGLVLALSLSVIKALQKSERNGKDISETLDEILEPIAALDKTAEVIFAAMLVASIDNNCTENIQMALICSYLRLQNIDNNNYPIFASITRKATKGAMLALFELATSHEYSANKDWLLVGLRQNRHHIECWEIMSSYLNEWLRYYSLSPELGLHYVNYNQDPEKSAQKYAQKIEERKNLLEDRMKDISDTEKIYLSEKMQQHDDIDTASLSTDAFTLMTGMLLSGFAQSLVAWNFSQAINGNYRSPHEEFRFLIQFNRHDWREARERLLAESSILQGDEISRTGKWALVGILRATSTESDAKHEVALVKELTAGEKNFPGWSLIENYCDTDPCDPFSETPTNIKDTAKKYSQINITNVRKSLGMGTEDHFLRGALPGLARFSPETAIDVYRKLADDISKRSDHELGLGLFFLEENTVLLSGQIVSQFLEKVVDSSGSDVADSKDAQEQQRNSQFSLLIALPHLDGNAQLEKLMSLPSNVPLLLDMIEFFQSADSDKLEDSLNTVDQSEDFNKQIAILLFACYSRTDLSQRACEIVQNLVSSTNSVVRAQAMNIIGYLKKPNLVKSFVGTGWKASLLDSKETYFERWYGSAIIIQAGVMGFLNANEVLDRISPEHYDTAASALGNDIKNNIFELLRASIERSLEIEFSFCPPEVEMILDTKKTNTAPLVSLSHSDQKLSTEDYDERQKPGWDAFEKFEDLLTKEKANLIIENIGSKAIESCVIVASEITKQLAETFLALPEQKLMRVQNIGLMIAEKLSELDPLLAKKLFEHLAGRRAFINLVFGLNKIPLESKCVWNSADNEEINSLRDERLDGAPTDHAIALEVVSALTFGKSQFLKNYVLDRLERDEPSMIARALMVCGFGEEVKSTEEILARFADAKGLIGTAAKAAKYAYDRNCWSHYWFTQMCQTSSSEDFWCSSILFLKIVDARHALWEHRIKRNGEPVKRFEPSIQNQLENRIQKWKTKREKTLFGLNAPSPVFVSGD